MFCPKCGGEYRPGFTNCADCFVPLVAEPPEAPAMGQPDVELVTIFSTANPLVVPLAKSLLGSAGIEFVTKGESGEGLATWGRLPAGYHAASVPVEFLVSTDDEEKARDLLAELEADAVTDDGPGDETDDEA